MNAEVSHYPTFCALGNEFGFNFPPQIQCPDQSQKCHIFEHVIGGGMINSDFYERWPAFLFFFFFFSRQYQNVSTFLWIVSVSSVNEVLKIPPLFFFFLSIQHANDSLLENNGWRRFSRRLRISAAQNAASLHRRV